MANQPQTLPEYQKLISQLIVERGYDKETIAEVFMLLLEEAGEFAKATRRHTGMKTGAHSKKHELAEEAADVFWLLIDLCNRLEIDLETAFRDKEAINKTRQWQ